MTRDDIIRMAREAGFTVVDSVDPQCWAGDHAADDESLERFAALVAAAERNRMIADGWRQCAQGQRTTQFCAVAEQARLEAREACARVCDAVAESANKAAVAGQYLIIRNGAEARMCSAAIRAALAQQAEPVQEPVAVPLIDYEALIAAAYAANKKWAQGTNGCVAFKHGAEWFRLQTLAAPAQRKPLTDAEIPALAEQVLKLSVYYDVWALLGTDGLVALVRAVEQAHGIKE